MDEIDKKKIKEAFKRLFNKDRKLLDVNSSERSISHKLAEHLQRLYPDYDVDCEYNRRGNLHKSMPQILFNEIKPSDRDAKTIFPDIIVHKRGNTNNNKIVIEVKKANSHESEKNDLIKLKEFTCKQGNYNYQIGLFVVFDVDHKKISKIELFENGEKYANFNIRIWDKDRNA